MSRFRMLPHAPVALTCVASFLAGCAGSSGSSGTNESKVTPSADPAPATSSSAAAPAHTTTTADKPVTSGPFWTLNGQTMPVKSALMKSYGGKMRTIYMSTGVITCDNIKGHGTALHSDKLMQIEIAPSMKPQESPLAKITYPTTDNKIAPFKLEKHSLKMPPAPVNGMVSMPIEFDFKDSVWDSRPEQVVSFKGPVEIKDCGVFPSSTDGEAVPQPKLKLEVSGEAVEIKGALLLNDPKEPRLVLTSEANGCNRDAFSDVTVELRFKGSSSDLTFAVLMGNRLDSAYQTSIPTTLKNIKSKMPVKLPKEGSKLEIPLNGELGLPDDFKLKLSGSVTALICKP